MSTSDLAFAGAPPAAGIGAPAAVAPPQVADLIVAYLERLGIEYVFGVPGGAIEPLYNALARSSRRGGPRPVLARHESGAAFMADGYARESGKIGVCCATSGPGATNLLTGIACAYDNGIPLLAITGQPALPSFGHKALQESACTGVNTLGMFRHCTRYDTLVSHAAQIERKLLNALMRAATAPHGPVHLSIPVDILRAPLADTVPSANLGALLQRAALLDETQVQALLAEIRQARRMVILVGGGHSCGEATDAILRLAEMTGSPFVTSPDGKGLVNVRHPLYHGVFGFAGHDCADALLRDDPDLILAIGTSLGEWTSGAWSPTLLNRRLVHIDASEDHLLRSPMARLHVRGNIRAVCERLAGLLAATAPAARSAPEKPASLLRDEAKFVSGATPIKPQRLMRELSRRFPPSTRFLADAGNSAAWAIHYLQPHDRRESPRHDAAACHPERRRRGDAGWLRVLMEFAPMGWAIGAAIGTARANPDCPVVCITGDGSYLMNGQEISVAAAEGLGVVFVVLNDSALGMVKHGQRLAGAEPIAFQLPAVDFRLQAEAMGIPGHIIRAPEDFDALDMAAIVARRGPTLLDVRIDGDEVPPIDLRMKALGTAP
ncbi:thiamine pyrophosphate-binding protein [Azospira restricta]|uniref:Thiamine pyrophosphate-binding protein n=1 Tax=Azospira restricta TaxID=404405 RepID=A0A974SQS8_9RHOO|nr:thiamine pyrophosphate-binding protein [Azospira restricta]QRJ64765.1 thiamine pyrophosphate-binding protein [Azospira restricta]